MKTFKDFALSEDVLRALDVLEYKNPTEVQEVVIQELLDYENVIVKSQTGSGKTAAFAIPLVENIDWDQRRPQALILTPTRELALQIKEDIFNIGRFKRIRVEAIFGRSSFEQQERALKGIVHLVVATPGRLIDHMKRRTIDLSQVQTLIIDESDEMLAMGFIDQIESILRKVPKNANIGLFSATMPDEIRDLGHRIMSDAKEIEIESVNLIEDRILQHVYHIEDHDKLESLKGILVVENPDSCILFCNTKALVEAVADMLWDLDIEVHTLHGDMEQRDRTKVITQFKRGQFRYLVATDVAARGLDIQDVQLVVNVDIPENAESYVHRIGRTARVDKQGKAISIVNNYGK
ncbi:MAG TPA: DEAD/DEAH box helicase, partial [Erysipelothrix sp.]|nr:DEAD/DEAH box helicase [Erysipelothrix sp.]